MQDTVLRNARIWAGGGSIANTAVIRDGFFSFVGRESDMTSATGARVVDLGGRFVMPGFTDSHVHLMGTGFAMKSVDLKGVASIDEAVRRVGERAAIEPWGTWIRGAGWDQNLWPGERFPTAAMLDAVTPHHPVLLDHTSGHCTWVNSLALRLAGITRDTAAPNGGAIDVDDLGEPTGILRDNASRLVAGVVPRPAQADRVAAVRDACTHAHKLGVTSVHAMAVGRGEFQALHALNDSAELRLRTRMFLAHEKLDEWIERNLATGDGDDMLRVGGVKFFSDGALGSLTAWMFEPYASSPSAGFPLQPIEELERDVRRALEQGLAPAIHAIGDRANHEVLNILERSARMAPSLPRRIEHAQVLAASDLPRFARLGVTASVQPIHATADWQKVDREWGDRGRLAYAFDSLASSGAILAFGSDTPVETMDPLAGVHAAVTRQTATREPEGGWHPNERISLEAALHSYTAGPALAVREDDHFGKIAPGYHGDFVVLSRDPFGLPVSELGDVRVEIACIGGEIVYRAS